MNCFVLAVVAADVDASFVIPKSTAIFRRSQEIIFLAKKNSPYHDGLVGAPRFEQQRSEHASRSR